MTRTANARLAGFLFLFYIATTAASMVLFDRATAGNGASAQIASVAQHVPQMRSGIVLSFLSIFDALILAVALYALTRDYDADLAMFALSCLVAEGVITAVYTIAMRTLLWIATDAAAATADLLGPLLLKALGWSGIVGATVFAVGSAVYAYLFLRARAIPVPLAWLGVAGSLVLAIGLPLGGAASPLMWIPVALFEVTLGAWLLIKGVRREEAV